jgi:hypothetical protein
MICDGTGGCVFGCGGNQFACGNKCYASNVAICGNTTSCANWDFESGIAGWTAFTNDSPVTLSSAASPERTTRSLAINFTNGGGGALINICGGAISTATLRLRAQIYMPLSLGSEGGTFTQIHNSGGSQSMSFAGGTWASIDVPFGDNGPSAQLGIYVAGGGPGAAGTIYIESLEMYQP